MAKEYQSTEINELAAALAKAQAEMKHAAKNAENPAFKRGGKGTPYAALPDVIDAAKPHLAKNGLSVIQPTDITDSGTLVLMTQLMHSSGQWIRGWYPVKPTKEDPQGFGSAMTYARRYAYSAITGIAAEDEDDDGNAASGRIPHEKPQAIFESSDLRDKYVANAIESLAKCNTHDELKTIKELDLARWNEMNASADQADVAAYKKIAAAYNERFKAVKSDAVKQPQTVDAIVKKAGIADDTIAY